VPRGFNLKYSIPMDLILISAAFLVTLASTYALLSVKMQLLKKELEQRSE